jgi:fibronectin type III domain protein
METVVWIVGGILLLDVLLLGWFVLRDHLEERRTDREIREVDKLWRELMGYPAHRPTDPVGAGQRSLASLTLERSVRDGSDGGAFISPVWKRSMRVAAVAAVMVTAVVVAVASPMGGLPGASTDRAESPASTASAAARDERQDRKDRNTGSKSDEGTGAATGAPAEEPAAHTAPKVVAAVPASSTAVTISWSAVQGATEYEVARSDTPPSAPTWEVVTSTDDTTISDSGLAPDTRYWYAIAAVVAGESGAPAVVTVTTEPALSSAPQLNVTPTDEGSVTLSWTGVDGATAYRVEQLIDGGWQTVSEEGTQLFTATGLEPGGTYTYRVIATNELGESPPSNEVTVTLPPPSDEEPSPSNGGGVDVVDPAPVNGGASDVIDPVTENGRAKDVVEPAPSTGGIVDVVDPLPVDGGALDVVEPSPAAVP